MVDINTIWQFDLRRGNSNDPRNGACFMDAVSWFEYGVLGDHPPCVCPVIAAFARRVNDAMSDVGRQRLKAFILRCPGTVDPASEPARAKYLAWQAIRVFAPLALDVSGLPAEANKLRTFTGTLSEAAAAAAAAEETARVTAEAAWAAWAAVAASVDAAWAAWALKAAAAAKAAARASRAVPAAWAVTAAETTAEAARRAAWAAEAAWAVTAAETTAEAAWAVTAALAVVAAEDAIVAALEGVLAIGRQAEPIGAVRIAETNASFELARAAG
jgi:hypothetical protein